MRFRKIKKRMLKLISSIVCIIYLIPTQGLKVFASDYEIIDDTDSRFSYSLGNANNGGWDSWGSVNYAETEHWSNTAGATIDISFNGTKLELYGKADPSHAMFSVSIDGGEAIECDAYSPATAKEQKLYESAELEEGDHIAKVTVLKKRNENAKPTGETVYGVQFVYGKVYGAKEENNENKNYISRVEDSQITDSDELFKFKYSGQWYAESGYHNLFSNGDDHYASKDGDSFTFKFIGSKIDIFGSKNSGHGIYSVSLDGESKGEIDATIVGATKHKQLLLSLDNLDEEEEHNLVVTNISKEKLGVQKAIQIDYVEVTHKAIQPSSIVLSDSEVHLESGMSKTIRATVLPSIATMREVIWESEDPEIASVDTEGVITAVSKEKASTRITATVKGTDLKEKVIVNVVPAVEYLSAYVGNTDMLETQADYNEVINNHKDNWTDVGWRGDVLNSKIVTASRNKEVHNAEVIVSDFVNGTNTIEASNIEIKWLKDVLANVGRGNTGAPVKPFPDVIYKGGKIDIAPQKVQSAWININIPEDAKPGTYKGKVTVKADELNEPYEFDYSFEVLNLVQPKTSETDTQIQVWQHPFAVANYYEVAEEDYFTEEHFKYMRASMEEYKELGGKDVVANIVEEAWGHQSYYGDPSMVKWTKKENGKFEFDYEWYDSWIKFQIESGVLDPKNGIGQIKCYSIVPWNNRITYFDEVIGKNIEKSMSPGSSEWEEVWTTFLKDFMSHSKEMGWFNMTYISMDERGIEQLEHAVNVIKAIKDEEGNSFKISSAFNYDSQADYSFTDKIDDISIGVSHVSHTSDKMRDMSKHRRELGLTTTIYNCTGDYPGNFTISDPGDNYWTIWYTMTHGTDGFMRWAWDNWVKDPLTNVTYKYWEPGDGWFIYPVEKGDNSNSNYYYSTPRYEMLKKGVRDINKAKFLMKQSEEFKTEITTLIRSMKRPKQGTAYGSAVAASEEDRMLTFTETKRMKDSIIEYSKEYINNQTEIVDKTALVEIIDEMKQLKEIDYTVSSWELFRKVLDEAQVVVDNEVADVEMVQATIVKLQESKAKLETRADIGEGEKLIEELEHRQLDSKDYTTESWNAYMNAYKALDKAVKDNSDISEELTDVVDALEKVEIIVVNKNELYSALEKCNEYKSTDYTDKTWKVFKEVYDKAYTVYKDENATQKDVDNATKALQLAADKLEKISTENPGSNGEDTEAPTMPKNIEVKNITENTADISWKASKDNVGVVGYEVYNGATLLATVADGITTKITGLIAGTEYELSIRAFDKSGNKSEAEKIRFTTKATEEEVGKETDIEQEVDKETKKEKVSKDSLPATGGVLPITSVSFSIIAMALGTVLFKKKKQ